MTVEDRIRDWCRQLLAAQNGEATARVIPLLKEAVRELEEKLKGSAA